MKLCGLNCDYRFVTEDYPRFKENPSFLNVKCVIVLSTHKTFFVNKILQREEVDKLMILIADPHFTQ